MLQEFLFSATQAGVLRYEFSQFKTALLDESHLSSRATLLENDYNRFSTLAWVNDCGYGFRNITLTTVKAYKRFLESVEREDLWEKYFFKWTPVLGAYKILDSIVKFFEENPNDILDNESIHYTEKPFNKHEFTTAFEFLREHGIAENREDITFPEERRYFKYKDVRFIWRTMHGQGTACQLIPIQDYSEWNKKIDWPMAFREELCCTIGFDDA